MDDCPWNKSVQFADRTSLRAECTRYNVSMTLGTTKTTTALPLASRSREDYLRMTTTFQARMVIRDPTAERLVFAAWHGQNHRVVGVTEAPLTSIAPSSGVPPAIRMSTQPMRQVPVETLTPLRYSPRKCEDQSLHSSSDEHYFTPTRVLLHFQPYPPTERKRKPEATVRSAVRELDGLSNYTQTSHLARRPRVVSDVRLRCEASHVRAPVH